MVLFIHNSVTYFANSPINSSFILYPFSGQQFLTETAQFFHTRADNLELLEKIETNQTVGGKEDAEELSEHVKEEGGEEEEGLEDEREGEEGEEGGGGERKLTRLVRNKNANIAEEAEDMEVEQLVTTSITPPVCTLSARQLRLQLAEMTEEERREWRVLALRPGTIPYAGTYNLSLTRTLTHFLALTLLPRFLAYSTSPTPTPHPPTHAHTILPTHLLTLTYFLPPIPCRISPFITG